MQDPATRLSVSAQRVLREPELWPRATSIRGAEPLLLRVVVCARGGDPCGPNGATRRLGVGTAQSSVGGDVDTAPRAKRADRVGGGVTVADT